MLINATKWYTSPSDLYQCYSATSDPILLQYISQSPTPSKNYYQPFAYVVINQKTGEIIAARDHFGFEPFYYYVDAQQFIFGSTIPDILKHLPISPRINAHQITHLMSARSAYDKKYTDETYYQHIYRVEPGHYLKIKSGKIVKIPFWQLDKNAETIKYASDAEYLDHFSALLNESTKENTAHVSPGHLAAEFSGGFDSTMVLMSAHEQGLHPALFTQVATPGSDIGNDFPHAKRVIEKLHCKDVHYLTAEDFDSIRVLEFCAEQFAGSSPHVFSILANNLHRAVQKAGHTTLLSGFGGDQCVSIQFGKNAYLREVLLERGYQEAWHALSAEYVAKGQIVPSQLKRFILFLKLTNPILYTMIGQLGEFKHIITNYLKSRVLPEKLSIPFYDSMRHYEYDVLQGRFKEDLYMRIEYSAVIAKTLGFQYRYPLLYPKLVEFCFRLPITQKYRNGLTRYLARQYLARYSIAECYNKNKKVGHIFPATLHKIATDFEKGLFKDYFNELPFVQYASSKRSHPFTAPMYAYMFKYYWRLNHL